MISRIKKLLGQDMGCYDMHRLLFDYAQETLPADLKSAMDEHLKDCRPCLDYMKTYRATVCATRDCCRPATEMPVELQQKLQEFIAKL
jgi:hypothetical protein